MDKISRKINSSTQADMVSNRFSYAKAAGSNTGRFTPNRPRNIDVQRVNQNDESRPMTPPAEKRKRVNEQGETLDTDNETSRLDNNQFEVPNNKRGFLRKDRDNDRRPGRRSNGAPVIRGTAST